MRRFSTNFPHSFTNSVTLRMSFHRDQKTLNQSLQSLQVTFLTLV